MSDAASRQREQLEAICGEIDVRLEIGLPPSMEDLRMWRRMIEEVLFPDPSIGRGALGDV